jgi:hypothetical protein
VLESELVGLAPEAAFAGVDPDELRLVSFSPEKLLETHLRRLGLTALPACRLVCKLALLELFH